MSQEPDQRSTARDQAKPSADFSRWGIWVALFALVGGLALIAVIRWDRGSTIAGPPPAFSGESQQFIPSNEPRPAPQTAFTDETGRSRTLADFRGRLLVVNFWATWCVPCLKEMPALDRLQAALGGEGGTVLAISQDRTGAAVVRPFYDKLGLSGLGVYLDPTGTLARAFGVKALPVTMLIDQRGREVGRLTGPAAWDSPEAVALLRHYLAAK